MIYFLSLTTMQIGWCIFHDLVANLWMRQVFFFYYLVWLVYISWSKHTVVYLPPVSWHLRGFWNTSCGIRPVLPGKGLDSDRMLSSEFSELICILPVCATREWLTGGLSQYWLQWGCNRGQGDRILDMNTLSEACAAEPYGMEPRHLIILLAPCRDALAPVCLE